MNKWLLVSLFTANLCMAQTPAESLTKLKEGNLRFQQDKTTCPDRNQIRRAALVGKQKPFATIVGCSDSRASPELVFDQGVGDLFVVRDAGNVVGPLQLDSVEFSVVHLGANLIVVLGHQNCGAVDAVITNNTQDIQNIVEVIAPHVKDLKNPTLEEATKANVKATVEYLRKAPVLDPLIKQGKLDVVGAYYHLESGEVEYLK